MTSTWWDAEGHETLRLVQNEREVRVTLRPGERFPDDFKRGRAVELEMNAGDRYLLKGRVKFRRLNVAILIGRLERA